MTEKDINKSRNTLPMSETDIKHIHADIETLKNDLAIIKHILSEEGRLTKEAQQRLESARKTPLSQYVEL